MSDDNFFIGSHNVEIELVVEEAIVLREFVKRQIMKKQFRIGDKSERNALMSLFAGLESFYTSSWDEKLNEAKELLSNHERAFELGEKRIHENYKET